MYGEKGKDYIDGEVGYDYAHDGPQKDKHFAETAISCH